jgi:hypothetical protein
VALASVTDLHKAIGPAIALTYPEAFDRRIPTPPQCQIDPSETQDPGPTIGIVFPLRLVCRVDPLDGGRNEQFAAVFNELQARGDKTKLMQLFGH